MTNEITSILRGISDSDTASKLASQFSDLLKHLGANRELTWENLGAITDCLENRITKIAILTDLSKEIEKIYNSFGQLALFFENNSLYLAGTAMLTELWNKLAEILPVTISRGGLGFYLGLIYHGRNDLGATSWWLLQAHAADLLSGQVGDTYHKGSAYFMLRLVFNVPEQVFDSMRNYRNKKLQNGDDQAQLPEHLVLQLYLEPKFANLFAYGSF